MTRAILLAAGYGTRLRPMTEHIPKCLVPIAGQPLLDIWLCNLLQAGIGPVLINTHYLADQVKTYLSASAYRDMVTLTHEPELLGTAGTLLANQAFFNGEDGLLIHADNFCFPDWAGFLQAHRNRPAHCVMTMMTFRTDAPSACGILEIDDQGVVIHMHEKVESPPGNLANGAVYCLSPELLTRLARTQAHATDFSTEILPELSGKIFTFEERGIFMDIGTPEAYAAANQINMNSRCH